MEEKAEARPGGSTSKISSHGDAPDDSRNEIWHLKPWVEEKHARDIESGFKKRELGVTWKDIHVKAVTASASVNENVVSQFNIARMVKDRRYKAPHKTIIQGSSGCVKPGEMLLVLGRPGSGCTTLLNILANRRGGYTSVDGDVWFGSMTASEASKYRGQIVMNTEEELFFPTLTVSQTIDFATRLKLSSKLPHGVQSAKQLQKETRDFLLRSMAIEHTHETKVGNEYVRGVSGGERKRVSIIECLATKGSIFCWDNSTRGLDASNALEYTKAIRTMTDILGLASIVTLYQAGNAVYELFDKVLVLDGGKQIFYGPREQAKEFMEHLGFACRDGANIADFLTGVTVPTERLIRPGWEHKFPRNNDAILSEYQKSSICAQMLAEIEYPTTNTAKNRTEAFRESISQEKSRYLPASSPRTADFVTQVKACIIRQYQIIWGDRATFLIKQVSTLIMALIAGSLFYDAPNDSSGLFLKSGALFFSILFNSLLAMSEVTDSFTGRPVLVKHKSFAFYHPAAFCLAQIVADIPIILFQTTILALPVYFMVGLVTTAASFFTYFAVVFVLTMCMTAMFRMVGACFGDFDDASKVSGLLMLASAMYSGYMIPKPSMHPWFVWLYWINPLSYAFEALLSNEFYGQIIPCVGDNLIPNGPGYANSAYQSCAGVRGSLPGEVFLTGDNFLKTLSYSHGHIWRNFGILWGWWALFLGVTIIATSFWGASSEKGRSLLIPREKSRRTPALHAITDEEAPAQSTEISENEEHRDSSSSSVSTSKEHPNNSSAGSGLVRNTSVFTWKDLKYTVKTPSGEKVLLDQVHGWVKPGMLGALMGSSGAGKTTLLDVLAQRKTEGTIYGSILVDGRPLPLSFQRSAGYCEQLDVHEPFSTVREALEFSALLRQPRGIPKNEKLKYVDTIIDLLELHDIADTLIGKPGAGLSVEQRKRVTIGVELVAKPSILIFLDEPTSGLDGQSAFNTIRFLRKLANAGQAILVTIHQPSAQLFSQFDTLLLLAKGGKTVYFGDIGENAQVIRNYFEKNGAPCPPNANPAEHMIDVVSGQLSHDKDWNQIWLNSPEYVAMIKTLEHIVANALSKPPATIDDGHEFAMSLWEQVKIVTQRMNIALFRNTGYANNKFILHIVTALFNGFSFWMIGNSVSDLQLRLFTIFNFIFVAPGVIAQLQPLFIDRRDVYEAREKKSKMYSWIAFVTGLIISELPYLCICAVLYYICWYYTIGFPVSSSRAGSTFFVMLMYEFLYTGIGQFIAAYAPNAVFAALINPLIIGILVAFCGVLVPYAQIQSFWRYWIYYLNPFNYLMGSLLVFGVWDTDVKCSDAELAVFNPPSGSTCEQYLSEYMQSLGARSTLLNPDDRSACRVCPFRSGSDYLATVNLNDYYYGWRDAAIVAIFVISSYILVYLLMKLRTKASKTAK
ncbi:hypothetical protein Plec18170_002118 [Paecilomyces lecythidis]